jgi:glutathione S-transferase
MSALPLLYTYRRCPYAMRARMALLQAGVDYTPFEIVLRDKPAQMLAVSPKGTVPVLVLEGGTVLEQSLDIVRWAFERSGDAQGWWARAQSPDNLALQVACDGPFKHHLDRTKYPERFADAQGREHHRAQAVAVLLQALEARLQAAPQLGGDAPCSLPPTRPGGRRSRCQRCRPGWRGGWCIRSLSGRCASGLMRRDQAVASGRLSSRFWGLSLSRPCSFMARPR